VPLPLPPPDSGNADRGSSLPTPPPSGSGLPIAPTGQSVCYRHPERAVGRHCTRCGKPACAECLQQVSVGSHCADCMKAARPDIKTRARYWQAGKPAIVTMTLIGINVAVFVILGLVYGISEMLSQSGGEAHLRFGLWARALDGEVSGLFRDENGDVVLSSGNEWYRLITSGFLHYGIIHLAFNMYILFILGNMLEPQLGRIKFLSIYLASMLGGSAGALLLQPNGLAAGASGAVFGLLGAAAVGMWHQGINPFRTGVGRLLLINLAFTFFWPNISVGGHLGGVIAGAICAFFMMAPAYKGFPRWAAGVTPVAVSMISIVVAFVAVR
jgi:membrane associated rhomboid family serine protease